MAPFLPYPAYESLNHEFAQFTWENLVELTGGDKQRNRENLNFKSAASAAVILAQILAQPSALEVASRWQTHFFHASHHCERDALPTELYPRTFTSSHGYKLFFGSL